MRRSGAWKCVALVLGASIASLGSGRAFAQISLYELARFSLNSTATSSNPEFIGSNPIAVGWNGSKLYVAGWNGGGSTVNTSIVEITNASSVTSGAATGFLTPTYSSTFGSLSTSSSRGYVGLAMNGSQLSAAWDSGSNSASGYQLFDASTNSLTWNLSAIGNTSAYVRGMAGPDFDPGYLGNPASGSGVGYLAQGSGARGLSNASTGAAIYTNPSVTGFTRGMIMTATGPLTSWRDMAFDPASGDVYTRVNNQVAKAARSGANSVTGSASSIIVSLTSTNSQGTNIGFMNGVQASSMNAFSNAYAGDLLIYNDKSLTNQAFTTNIKFANTSGTAVTGNWTFLSPTPSTSVTSIYDFEWDSTTQTLAVVDYTNRSVSIFSTAVPEPTTWALLGTVGVGAGLASIRRRWSRA